MGERRFVVEVTYPHAPDDRHDECFECSSVDGLTRVIDEMTGIGVWASLEVAVEVALGEGFEFEDPESGRTVTAECAPDEAGDMLAADGLGVLVGGGR